MEALWTRKLHLCVALFILKEVQSEHIHLPSLVEHGVEGKSLVLLVETRLQLDQVEIQGTWSHTGPGGTRTTLVTFTKDEAIADMTYRSRLVFANPSLSLQIQRLNPADEGDYHLDLNIEFLKNRGNVTKEQRTVHVTVDVFISTPVIERTPSYTVVEDKANVTWTCSVARGTRVSFQWLKDNVTLGAGDRYWFSQDNSTLVISPVKKEDMGDYHCVASNPISLRHSKTSDLNVYYGPYNLVVNADQGLRTREVLTINPGELVFFDCQADSNPPNSYVWISKTQNVTQVITEGPRLKVLSSPESQAKEFLCRAFNNVTQKQDEAQITLVVASLSTGQEKHTQENSSLSLLAVITICSFFIICSMLLIFLRRTCHPKKVLMSIYNRPLTQQKRPHLSGHEDATVDFGIYEFVSIPEKMESTQSSCRSLARLGSIQDMHTTIYDVIRHVPETPTQSLLK